MQVIIPVSTVQRAVRYSADAMWFEAIYAFWERESVRAVILSRCLWNYVSQKLFKLLYKLFNEEIWIVQHYNYFTRAGQKLRWCHCMSCQTSHGRRVISLRSPFLENADQTSQCDYRPIMIGSRSIGAPIEKTPQFCLHYQFQIMFWKDDI